MAPPYNPGAQFKVRLQGALSGGTPWGNNWQFQLQAPASTLSFADVVADMDEVCTEIAEAFAAFQADTWDWTHYSVAELDDSVVSGLLPLSGVVTGALTGPILPTQTTGQVSFPTGVSKRILKKAVPALLEAQTVEATGQFTTGFQTNLKAALEFLRVTIEATNGGWRYSYRNPDDNTQPLLFPQAVNVTVTPKVQRRRRLA